MNDINKDVEIFSGKTFSGLLQDIYKNSLHKKKQIDILIDELKPLITDVAQAAIIVPLVADYLDVSVKNDDELVKMASVYQKYIAAEKRVLDSNNSNGEMLTDEERKQLLSDISIDVKSIKKTESYINDDIKILEEKSEKIIDKSRID